MKQSEIFKKFGLVNTIGISLIFTNSLFVLCAILYKIHGETVSLYLSLINSILAIILFLAYIFWFLKPFNLLNLYLKSLAKRNVTNVPTRLFPKSSQFRHVHRINSRFAYLQNRIQDLIGGKHTNVPENCDVETSIVSSLKEHLETIKTEELKWKEAEKIRTWMNQGVAKFSELLRHNASDFNENSRLILKELVGYVSANLGGIFIVDADNEYLEMIAAYAYDRNKIANKKLDYGDGLYGAACFEKQTIFFTEIPADYLEIRSGMGGAQPKSLIIVPLVYDNKVYGVIELASFEVFAKHEIDFIEKIAEIFASAFSVSRMGKTTQDLLEQSQTQTKELAQQEEELRQNMEEMQAQQEEMQQKKDELEESEKLMRNIIDLVPFPIFVKNIKRQYIMANQEQAKLFNVPVETLLGKSDHELIQNVDELSAIKKSDDKVLDKNELVKLPEQSISLPDGTLRILQTVKVPFENNVTHNRNILGVSVDYTAQRKIEEELSESKAKLKSLQEQIEEVHS